MRDRSSRWRFALSCISSLSIALLTKPANAQTMQAGVGAHLGSGGIGVEIDVAHRRASAYMRGSVSPNAAMRSAGVRLYVIGDRGSAFYVGGAIAGLTCAEVDLGGVATSCDGEWHRAWAVLLGVESGSRPSGWSIFVDGGPYLGVRDVPGIRNWVFSGGVRVRGP
jgi:hypothetical protein